MYPDVLNTVKENASDKMSDNLTEIIICHVAAMPGFKITGFSASTSFPLPPLFHILLTPYSVLFPPPKHPSRLSLIFLPSKTPQKHLLPWLVVSRLFQTLISTSSILPSVPWWKSLQDLWGSLKICKDPHGSSKICKDPTKILNDKDL